jgi:hypothetical protein
LVEEIIHHLGPLEAIRVEEEEEDRVEEEEEEDRVEEEEEEDRVEEEVEERRMRGLV